MLKSSPITDLPKSGTAKAQSTPCRHSFIITSNRDDTFTYKASITAADAGGQYYIGEDQNVPVGFSPNTVPATAFLVTRCQHCHYDGDGQSPEQPQVLRCGVTSTLWAWRLFGVLERT
jgi:hypothetical protein